MTTIKFNGPEGRWFENEYEFNPSCYGQAADLCLQMGEGWDWEEVNPKSVSQLLDQFIAENGGNARDALNVALARLENATALLLVAQQESEDVLVNFLDADKEPEPEIQWEKLEGWVQYVAMDASGQWWKYEVEPDRDDRDCDWWSVEGRKRLIQLNAIPFTAPDWRTSLHKRPNPTSNDKFAVALRQILDIRFAEYPDGDQSATYKIITRMQRIARNALQ